MSGAHGLALCSLRRAPPPPICRAVCFGDGHHQRPLDVEVRGPVVEVVEAVVLDEKVVEVVVVVVVLDEKVVVVVEVEVVVEVVEAVVLDEKVVVVVVVVVVAVVVVVEAVVLA
ncbi:unnamed protein product [Boreogadus saida]